MEKRLFLTGLTTLVLALTGCTIQPGVPDPVPNPDHKPITRDLKRDTIFEVRAYDKLDHEVARIITITVTATDVAGRPGDLSDPADPSKLTKRVFIQTRTPVRYTNTALPGIASLTFTAFVQGYGGDNATLEITDGLGDLTRVTNSIEFAKVAPKLENGVMTLGCTAYIE